MSFNERERQRSSNVTKIMEHHLLDVTIRFNGGEKSTILVPISIRSIGNVIYRAFLLLPLNGFPGSTVVKAGGLIFIDEDEL